MLDSLPQIDRRHVLAFAHSREDLLPTILGYGRIVDEYRFDADVEPQTFVAVVECPDEQTAKTIAQQLPNGSRAVFSHSEAISHAFALGAKTTAAFDD